MRVRMVVGKRGPQWGGPGVMGRVLGALRLDMLFPLFLIFGFRRLPAFSFH